MSLNSDNCVKKDDLKVVIIGSGASGVGACQHLERAGFKPIILEARNRIGGRIYEDEFTPNLKYNQESQFNQEKYIPRINIQLGANWIHGLNSEINPIYGIAKDELHLDFFESSADNVPGDDILLFLPNICSNDAAVGEKDSGERDKKQYFPISKLIYEKLQKRMAWIDEHVGDLSTMTKKDISLLISLRDAVKKSELCVDEGTDGESDSDVNNRHVTENTDNSLHAGITYSEEQNPKLKFGPCSDTELSAINWCFDRLSIDCAMDCDSISTRYYADADSDGLLGEAVVAGGLFQVIQYVSRDMDIRLNQCVTDIWYHRSTNVPRYEIKCSDGTAYTADILIYTVPLGVSIREISELESNEKQSYQNPDFGPDSNAHSRNCITFHPKIPFAIRQSRKYNDVDTNFPTDADTHPITGITMEYELRMGLMNLIHLWFPYPFWNNWNRNKSPKTFDSVNVETNISTSGFPEFESELQIPKDMRIIGFGRPVDETASFTTFFIPPPFLDQFEQEQHVLMIQTSGAFAEKIEKMSNEEIVEEVMKIFRQCFVNSEPSLAPDIPAPIGCKHSSWKSDCYAGGSYSYKHILDESIDRKLATTLSKDDGEEEWEHLYIAGEHTTVLNQATVHGAYLSGIREAKLLLASL